MQEKVYLFWVPKRFIYFFEVVASTNQFTKHDIPEATVPVALNFCHLGRMK